MNPEPGLGLSLGQHSPCVLVGFLWFPRNPPINMPSKWIGCAKLPLAVNVCGAL